jgi:cytochrome c553
MLELIVVGLIVLGAAAWLVIRTVRIARGKAPACGCCARSCDRCHGDCGTITEKTKQPKGA